MRQTRIGFTAAVAAALLQACTASQSAQNVAADSPQVTVDPAITQVAINGNKTFTAYLGAALATTVTWKVRETGGGTINAGQYTAPATTGTYHVDATVGAVTGSATVNVVPVVIDVTVTPATRSVYRNESYTFSATVTGTADQTVTWSVREAGGGSMSGATYTAPGTDGTYHVEARSPASTVAVGVATVTVTARGSVVVGDVPTGTDLTLSVDATTGQQPISPYIFGLNTASSTYANFKSRSNGQFSCDGQEQYGENSIPASRVGSTRVGANRSPWNWETDLSSSGVDLSPPQLDYWASKQQLCTPYWGQTAGAAKGIIEDAIHDGIPATVVTVPMIGWVPKTTGSPSTPSTPDQNTPATGLSSTLWVQEVAARTVGVDQATATPNTSDAFSYQEDFIKWLDVNYGPGNGRDGVNRWTTEPSRIILQLDNEPDIWGNNTHFEIRGQASGGTCSNSSSTGCIYTGYDELLQKTEEHAIAAKVVAPQALVMAGSWAVWTGLIKGSPGQPTSITSWAQAHGEPGANYAYYAQYYLKKLKALETKWSSTLAGRRLVDIFDFHPYVQSDAVGANARTQTTAVANERVDYARTFWDPTYVENSWVPGALPDCNPSPCAVQMIPRMKKWMTDAGFTTWPQDPNGMKLSFTEWALFRQGDVSMAAGMADIMGVFAREGVYLSTYWLMGSEYDTNDYVCAGSDSTTYGTHPSCRYNKAQACLHAALEAWRDYDGAGGRAGDTYVKSASTDGVRASVYGTMNAGDSSRTIIVAVNRRENTLNAGLSVTAPVRYTTAEWYQVTGGNGTAASCTKPVRKTDITLPLVNALTASLPPYSVNVFVLK